MSNQQENETKKVMPVRLSTPPTGGKMHYDLIVIGFTIVFIVLTLIILNNTKWALHWQPKGVENLVSTAGAMFIIALAIERYIKVFMVDSEEEESLYLKYSLRLLEKNF